MAFGYRRHVSLELLPANAVTSWPCCSRFWVENVLISPTKQLSPHQFWAWRRPIEMNSSGILGLASQIFASKYRICAWLGFCFRWWFGPLKDENRTTICGRNWACPDGFWSVLALRRCCWNVCLKQYGWGLNDGPHKDGLKRWIRRIYGFVPTAA